MHLLVSTKDNKDILNWRKQTNTSVPFCNQKAKHLSNKSHVTKKVKFKKIYEFKNSQAINILRNILTTNVEAIKRQICLKRINTI